MWMFYYPKRVKLKTFLRCFWEGECLLINEPYECKTWSSSVFRVVFMLLLLYSRKLAVFKSMWKTLRHPFISVTWRITKWNWIFSFYSCWIKSRLSNTLYRSGCRRQFTLTLNILRTYTTDQQSGVSKILLLCKTRLYLMKNIVKIVIL